MITQPMSLLDDGLGLRLGMFILRFGCTCFVQW